MVSLAAALAVKGNKSINIAAAKIDIEFLSETYSIFSVLSNISGVVV